VGGEVGVKAKKKRPKGHDKPFSADLGVGEAKTPRLGKVREGSRKELGGGLTCWKCVHAEHFYTDTRLSGLQKVLRSGLSRLAKNPKSFFSLGVDRVTPPVYSGASRKVGTIRYASLLEGKAHSEKELTRKT